MGTTAQKGAYLKDTKSLLKQKINNLGGDITDETTFREYANQLDGIYEALPKTEFEEGESVTLENTLKGKLDFQDGKVGFGQSSQDTTNGYQILSLTNGSYSVSGITAKVQDGEITLNGTSTSGASIYIPIVDISLLTTDKFSFAFNRTGDFPSGMGAYFTDSSKNLIRWSFGQAGLRDATNFSPQADTTASYFHIAVNTTGTSFSNFKLKPMFEKGATSHTWEEYSGGYTSPSPNWKQQVKCVAGRNKFDKSAVTPNAYINTSGEVVTGAVGYCASDWIKVSTGNIVWGATSGNGYSLSIYNSSKTFVRAVGRTNNNAMVIPIANGEEYIRFTILNADLSSMQIEEGTETHSYTPYNTIQETVRGKNVLPFDIQTIKSLNTTGTWNGNVYTTNGVSYELKADGTISLTGTASGTSVLYIKKDPQFIGEMIMNGCPEGGDYNKYFLQYSNGINTSFNETGEGINITQFTVTNCTVDIVVRTGINTNGLVFKPMISTNGGDYEPYKTPKTYQFSLGDHKFYGIGTYRDYILRTTGKNLLNIANFEEGYSISNVDGKPVPYTTTLRITNTTPIDVEGLDKVTLSFTAWTGGDKFIYSLLKSDNTLVAREAAKTSGTTITIGEAKYLYICFYDGATLSNVKDAMLVKGSTASDYQPFGVGNWYKVGKIGEVQFANVNNIYQEAVFGVNKKYFFQTISTAKSLGNPSYNFLCEILSKSNGVANDYSGFFNGTNIVVLLNDSDTKETATSKYTGKALHYVLANPTYTQITGTLAEQLEEWWNGQSLDGTTIIEGDGDLPMLINVRALKGA